MTEDVSELSPFVFFAVLAAAFANEYLSLISLFS